MARSGSTTPTRNSKATRTTILDATGELIAEKGLDGFTISEIGRRGSVNRSLIYHYFKNRENLIVETIGHIMGRYEDVDPGGGGDAIERNLRMHIDHPEIARAIYHMLLDENRLPALWPRLQSAIQALEKMRRQGDSSFDPTFMAILISLPQLSWAFSRREFARMLGMTVDEADKRFIASMRWMTELALASMTGPGDEPASAHPSSP